MTEFLEQAALSQPLLSETFFTQALAAFAIMVLLVWVLPGLIHKQHHAGEEDGDAIASHPRLKIHL